MKRELERISWQSYGKGKEKEKRLNFINYRLKHILLFNNLSSLQFIRSHLRTLLIVPRV
jgi:hypothetical protein